MVEGLEDRKLLYATLGGTWVYGSRITYSFVPDGTNVGGPTSNLYATLDAKYATATWKAAIEKAAVIWSSYANINLALVSDSGADMGIYGNQQNDSRFGDIRIAMIPQNTGAMAFTVLPPPFNGGTEAGDIVFNSNIDWKVNNNYDLETVAIHEFGHALGLDHSAISSAVMYANYSTLKQSLTTDDTSGIQAVWGAYPADSINDGSFATATNITGYIDGNGQIARANQSMAGSADRDYFVVTAPANTTGSMVVSVQSTNLSSVSPRVVVFNSSYGVIGSSQLPDSYGGTATYTVTGVTPGKTYYITALPASALGSYGAYGLLVNFGSQSQAPIAPPNTTVAWQYGTGGGSIGLAEPGGGHGLGSSHHMIRFGNHFAFADVLMPDSPSAVSPVADPQGLNIPVSPGGPTNAAAPWYLNDPTLTFAPGVTVDTAVAPSTLWGVIDNAIAQIDAEFASTFSSILRTVRDRNVIVNLG